jgi:putative acetyltransferase
MTIRSRNPEDNVVLVEVWLRSVRATHTFLREHDIEDLYPQVRDQYLPAVEVSVYETVDGLIVGFIGVHEAQVEMLFVDPSHFGCGVGTSLLDHVKRQHPNLTVDVNEQNPQAHAFYLRHGFKDIGRSPTDSAGRPFPLLHMALQA